MSRTLSATHGLVSDGKHMRGVWTPSDGDGLDNAALVARSLTNIKGHPTWKVFMGEIPTAFQRGTQTEPPHFCYLDDYACHTIFTSKLYTNEELYRFWPFDFNQQGVVSKSRKNRGRPVFTDDSKTDFAKAPMRSRKELYVFSGEPRFTSYAPVRPKKLTRMEQEVQGEMAREIATVRSQAVEEIAQKSLVTPSEAAKKYSEAIVRGHATGSYPMLTHFNIGQIRTSKSTQSGLAIQDPSSKKVKVKSVHPGFPSYTPKPLSLPPCGATDSPFGSIARGTSIIQDPEASRDTADQLPSNGMRKRRAATTDDTGSRKRAQPNGQDKSAKPNGMNFDGANDINGMVAPMEHEVDDEGYNTVPQGSQETTPDEKLKQVERDLEASYLHIKAIERREQHLREVITIMLAGRSAQQAELIKRIIALQKLTDSALALMEALKKLSDTATGEVQPTSALVDRIGSVLDEPGKYMYDNGLDEEWEELLEQSRKLDRRHGQKENRPERRWMFA